MSGAEQEMYVETGATEIGLCAAAWLERRYHDDFTDEEQAALEDWLAQSSAHRVAYLRLEDAWQYADRLAALRSHSSEVPQPVRHTRAAIKTVAAAAIAVGLLGAGAVVFLSAPHERVYATAIGGHQHLTLDDGSQIELNTDTVLRIASNAERRTVTLEKGEAYFQITHNAKRSFVVVADGRRLTDLGTKFLVRKDAHRLRVAVFDGRVQFEPESRSPNAHAALLTTGDVLLTTQAAQSVQRKSAAALMKDLGWRHGVVTLDNTTLGDAAAEFNRYNNRKLVIADAQVARLRIVGTFQSDNLDAFTSVAQDIFGLRVEKHNTEIVISR